MKISKHEAGQEKRILTGMIANDVVCGHIAAKWLADGMFRSRWANLVGGWCVKHYRRYGVAPRADIEPLFESWADRATADETVGLVDAFLSGLSGAYEEEDEEINPDYLVDRAGEHFNAVALERVAEVVQGHVNGGDVDKALEALGRWDKVELGAGAGVDLLLDRAAVEDAFAAKADPLITYPGDLGKFFGDQLGRDEFVALTGATGRGKTWWLIDIAWMGVKQRRRVAFFEVGDMSQAQIIRRFAARIVGLPVKPPYRDIRVPTAITREDGGRVADVEYEMKSFGGPLTAAQTWEVFQKKTRRNKKIGEYLRLSVHPNSSINVAGIRSTLAVWERSGWVPDVVVVDYADILAGPAGYTPGDREAINQTWKELRSLSQEIHGLVVTATQADAASYTANTISRSNFSDDRRKNDHVTGMLGINATEEEQDAGVCRLNWTKRREEAYLESKCVYVAGCLAIGRPHIISTY